MSSDFSAALQAHFNSQQEATSPKDSDTYGQLTALIEKVSGVDSESIERDARLADLGISSLALVELTVRAEEAFKVQFDEGTVLNFDTVGDVAAYIDERKD
ncbi:acyl carrier protein [Corynebacterium endometrii]|uniref:Meromycolate extension acyl carrier protein n=1 Tax=Corynebacterium endometrii TaxID=2488819 RepID=A0A4P7QGK5_9CORY|nr:acyl carrier protein [Corynebacterium endometrii]QCB28901.1 Meromycolate extension acyl carrier protein [Corynebacterium endometrii]